MKGNSYHITGEGRMTLSTFMSNVFLMMFLGLLISGATAFWVFSDPNVLMSIVGDKFVFYVILGAELGLVIYLSSRISSMRFDIAVFMFVLYSALSGLTLSVIFAVYTMESIAHVFVITALTFGSMSLYGYTTERDLTGIGSFLFMGLIGIIGAMIVNFFMRSDTFSYVVSIAAVIIFTGLTAYDVQKLKQVYEEVHEKDPEEVRKWTVLGALVLYLDFINLFLHLLRLLGRRK